MPDKDETVKQIRAELAANRAKLAAATTEAFEALKPANIARNSAEQIKTFAKTEVNAAFGQFRNPDGSFNLNRAVMIGGALVGVVAVLVTVKSATRQRRALPSQVRRELER